MQTLEFEDYNSMFSETLALVTWRRNILCFRFQVSSVIDVSSSDVNQEYPSNVYQYLNVHRDHLGIFDNENSDLVGHR